MLFMMMIEENGGYGSRFDVIILMNKISLNNFYNTLRLACGLAEGNRMILVDSLFTVALFPSLFYFFFMCQG